MCSGGQRERLDPRGPPRLSVCVICSIYILIICVTCIYEIHIYPAWGLSGDLYFTRPPVCKHAFHHQGKRGVPKHLLVTRGSQTPAQTLDGLAERGEACVPHKAGQFPTCSCEGSFPVCRRHAGANDATISQQLCGHQQRPSWCVIKNTTASKIPGQGESGLCIITDYTPQPQHPEFPNPHSPCLTRFIFLKLAESYFSLD